ncbi:GNAT family N-acetyltransferase [Micromonospora parathelypteridis]|uniref:Lysine N-acyltransferase MbtK n=1 Tax=Micromonospora parathelypteridis TaxID=1839617 RepID=A0A840VFT5_9ACTN|nr:GNAT family N-acetyltransferase [Micromonospora parathelypteridis]MBB5475637.1 penicillin amidase [Micromonospora parathelypteridis]GGO27276.1 acetyltransferase [Micromonospora parathelypteridis]
MSADTTTPDQHHYRRDVTGFGVVTIRPVRPNEDVDLLHGWVTQDRARFWGMREASRERVHEIYAYLDSSTTHHAYLVHRDGVPAALAQTYQPEADPVGECYDVRPGDVGVHLLIGPSTGVERGFTGALFGAILDFVLADPGRLRVVMEPDARNDRAIRRLLRTGFRLGPLIDLPDKGARLLFLDRPGTTTG